MEKSACCCSDRPDAARVGKTLWARTSEPCPSPRVSYIQQPGARLIRRAGVQRCQTSRREAILRRWAWYDKYFAYSMAYGMQDYERTIAARKEALFAELFQLPLESLLEIGIGAGANNKYYAEQQGMHITGIDPNPEMAPFALEAAESAKLDKAQVSLLQGTAEQLPVGSQSQDAVVCTLVLCSVPSVATALSEVQRVLKPGGKLLFIEHVLAPGRPLRIMQNILNPLQQAAADGCHLDRNTLDSIRTAGFASVKADSFVVPNLGLIGPHTAGIAQM